MASGQTVEITYTHPETQPPVYVAASLTSPPWEPHEMDIDEKKTDAGDLIFRKEFEGVKEGEYQYKFRLGPGIVTDDAGFRNNLLVPTSELPNAPPAPMSTEDLETHTADQATEAPSFLKEPKTEHTQTQPQKQIEEIPAASQESVPVPFTVVEKVPDQPQPEYGDIETESLHEKKEQRLADAEPDAVRVLPEADTETEQSKPESDAAPAIPTLIVEKTDDEPRHGDDMGPDATAGQKEAHEKRLADAEPDAVVITPDPEDKDQTADAVDTDDDVPECERSPMFRHEAFHDEDGDAEDDEGHVSELERVPTFKHETFEDSNDEATSPHLDALVTSGPTPLFAFERSTSNHDLATMNSHDEDEEEVDLNDPSLERFPTERDEIYRHIARTESRLQEDEAAEPTSRPSSRPSSPLETRHAYFSAAISVESSSRSAPYLRRRMSWSARRRISSPALAREQQPSTETAERAPAQSDGSHDLPAPAAENAGPLTPPMTPKGFLLDETKPVALTERRGNESSASTAVAPSAAESAKPAKAESEGLRRRKGEEDKGVEIHESEVSRASSEETERETEREGDRRQGDAGFLAAIWRAIFGSLGSGITFFLSLIRGWAEEALHGAYGGENDEHV
ncbi:hypothetical protein H2199_006463 [Coniosporium tulheliwenetii]|uniref:Uncharacterized protein n=1 Tax=Coniosporium tulheliwenetii TaxID=3383036 RepID=A0ACC2YVW0_9PEZI|nr:hypothetical protein H2199_006463 [Cladosporium sp. JES 115]